MYERLFTFTATFTCTYAAWKHFHTDQTQRAKAGMVHVNHMPLSAHVSISSCLYLRWICRVFAPCFSHWQLCARPSSHKYRQQQELAQLTSGLALV